MLYSKGTTDARRGEVCRFCPEKGGTSCNWPEQAESSQPQPIPHTPGGESQSPPDLGMAWPLSCSFRKVSSYCGSSTYVISHCTTSSTVQLYTVGRDEQSLDSRMQALLELIITVTSAFSLTACLCVYHLPLPQNLNYERSTYCTFCLTHRGWTCSSTIPAFGMKSS